MGIPKSNCIECGHQLVDDNPPFQVREGDGCNCFYCGCPMEFGKDLRLIKPSVITPKMKAASKLIKRMNRVKVI